METPVRSVAKALTWQGMGLVTMTGIGWLVTGSAAAGGAIAAVSAATSLVTYILHERVWDRIPWGRGRPGAALTRPRGAPADRA